MKLQRNVAPSFPKAKVFMLDKFRKMRVGMDCMILETAQDFRKFMSYRFKLSKEGMKFSEELAEKGRIKVWRIK
jgi:hypothetical protein